MMSGTNHSRVIVESDASSIMAKLNHPSPDRSYIGLALQDIRNLVPRFTSLQSRFVRRLGNSVAHFMAHMYIPVGVEQVFTDAYPLDLCNLLLLDLI